MSNASPRAGRKALLLGSLLVLVWLLNVCGRVQKAEAIWLTVPSSGTKCFFEEIQTNVVVLADYYIVDEDHPKIHTPTISARVTSPYGSNLHHNENVTHGQFAFTTSEAGNYLACFWMGGQHPGGELTIGLDWRIGIAARDWDSVARKEKIQGVELELQKLEGAVQAIHDNLIFLKNREAEMRKTSELTNARVGWFSIMSLGVCVVVSVLQVWYLRHYFQKKKLI